MSTVTRQGHVHWSRTVYLARRAGHDGVYAVKKLSKRTIATKNMVEQGVSPLLYLPLLGRVHMMANARRLAVVAERDALALVDSEYLVRIYYSLQSADAIYLVMEYLVGGDVASLLCVMGCLPEDWARFYTAELVAAIDYLHAHVCPRRPCPGPHQTYLLK